MKKTLSIGILAVLAFAACGGPKDQGLLSSLGRTQDYVSKRVSSYDRTGGNKDSLTIKAGETAVLADLKGPGAIHHIWVTIAAEAFYGRKIVLRLYWDGEAAPSVEAPIGDFFGVGHGLDRNVDSIPIAVSSEGRARNCYWPMPFRRSARVTVTNEGTAEVPAFYYYVDYRELKSLPADAVYFHAQYHQETPCEPGRNYVILDAEGRGHYVGCNLSVLERAMGWWGEGDDMIYVDGESFPSLQGTGSEDYFSDAWGMRESARPFYGCPLQEEDFLAGAKATVYRFHIPDPIPFKTSIRATIEHGHANDRSDFYSSTAYWYQAEPHKPFPALPPVAARLPYALEPPDGFVRPSWKEAAAAGGSEFRDAALKLRFKAGRAASSATAYYGPSGERYSVLTTEKSKPGSTVEIEFPVEVGERYDVSLHLLKGPAMGRIEVAAVRTALGLAAFAPAAFDGYAKDREWGVLTLKSIRLDPGENTIVLRVAGKAEPSLGMEAGFLGISLAPSGRIFLADWNLVGPFDAPDMDYLTVPYPPEADSGLTKTYVGKGNAAIAWRKVKAEPSGYVRLTELVKPNEQAVIYALGWLSSPADASAVMLVGSDDGVRVWINDALVYSNPAYRGASPDQDRIKVSLRKGWNKVMIKVLQGAGGWGYYVRFADPDGKFGWTTDLKNQP
jgi:hypothetical protein